MALVNLDIMDIRIGECGEPTSHGVGLKQVLLSKDETQTDITQIAATRLRAGEEVVEHVHPDMEECFIFERGKLWFLYEGRMTPMQAGTYVRVPAGVGHGIRAITDVRMISIGCKVKDHE